MRRLIVIALLLLACTPGAARGHWTALYLTNNQEYDASGDGNDCPQYQDVKVGETGGNFDTAGNYHFGGAILMRGVLKVGSCRVVMP